jgi:hypothetical protein
MRHRQCIHRKYVIHELVLLAVVEIKDVHKTRFQLYPIPVYLAKPIVKTLKPFCPDHTKGTAAAVCLGIFASKEKGDEFPGMVGVKVGEKEVSNL